MLNYTERDTRQGFFQSLLSVLLLSILLLILYFLKSEPKSIDSYFHIANLKSILEDGNLRNSTEPISYFLFFIIKKISFSSLNFGFLLFISINMSIFFHQAFYLFKREVWSLNHYISVFLLSLIPMNFNLPFLFFQEIVCANLILVLFITTKFDTIQNLLFVIFLSIISFITSIPMFLFLYTIYVSLSSFLFMGKQKSRTTVFYKKANIAGRIFFIYLILFITALIYIYYTQFFGQDSLKFLFSKFFIYSYRILLVFVFSFILYYLLENEKELLNQITSIFGIILILILGYLSFISKSDLPESLEKDSASIKQLYSSGKISKSQNIFSSEFFSNYMYTKESEKTYTLDFNKIKKEDYIFVETSLNLEKIIIDKNFKYKTFPLFKISEKNILVSREYFEKISSDKNDLNRFVLDTIEKNQKKETPYLRWNLAFCKLFGYK